MIGDNTAAGTGTPSVWLFHGENARFASGVFTDREAALEWVAAHHLTGVLTQYRVGDGCYDLAVKEGNFQPTKPHHGSPSHIAGFSPSGPHLHVHDGQPD